MDPQSENLLKDIRDEIQLQTELMKQNYADATQLQEASIAHQSRALRTILILCIVIGIFCGTLVALVIAGRK